jgi:N-acetylglucosaminyldiphosphoundecaprenol N-acetyl-beta-D-mannosaminyltransferase
MSNSLTNFALGLIKCSPHTIPQLLREVNFLLNNKENINRIILCINAHIFNLAIHNKRLQNDLNSARIIAADGKSIVFASRIMGYSVPERCNMTEAFRAFLGSNEFRKNAGILIGNTEKEAKKASENINRCSKHCHIVRSISGFMQDSDYEMIFDAMEKPDFVFIGMGTPRTERLSKIAQMRFPQAIIWGIGAGTIKVFAGSMTEAPVILRRMGMQWFFRLFNDPRALWKRYLVGNLSFIIEVAKIRIRGSAKA